MSTDITSYPTLNTYAVLASNKIISQYTTTVTNGKFGSSQGSLYINGTNDDLNVSTAVSELNSLVSSINTISPTPLSTFSGFISIVPNIRYNSSTLNLSGKTIFLSTSNTIPTFYITSDSDIIFDSNTIISQSGSNISTCRIFWVAGADIIFSGTSPEKIPGIFIAGNSITSNENNFYGRLYTQTGDIEFMPKANVDGLCRTYPYSNTGLLGSTLNPIDTPVICYLKGTLILTQQGFVPIENIKANHKVVTKGKIHKNKYIKSDATLELKPVLWISKFKVFNLNTKSLPICIKQHALGENYPFKDLYVSPNHSLLINNKMVLAQNLVNNKTIYQDKECTDVEYYHLECENHSAIIANGVLSESYIESNNRYIFENSINIRRKNNLKQIKNIK